MSQHSSIKFDEILSADKETHVVIHNFPDPDAIASAMGIIQMIKHLGHKPGNIYYTGEVSHPQNKSMVTLLNANLINYEDDPFEDGSEVILVDTNNVGEESNQPLIDPKSVKVVAIIDHHKGKHPRGAKIDSRHVGASASIVWEYLKKANFDFDSEEGKILATALVTGIFTDTQSLMSDNIATLDFEAYQVLLRSVDKQKLKSIMNYPLPTYLFELRQRAFLKENQIVEESVMVAGIGIINPSKRDALPIIADELLRMNGISTAIVFAIIGDMIDISVRSSDITMDVAKFVQSVFHNGGGKQGAGRSTIPLGFFSMNGNDELNTDIWEVAKKMVMNKVATTVKGD
ncbi:MAG: DHH family phosphoesterase [Elusimicrobiota bacterium]